MAPSAATACCPPHHTATLSKFTCMCPDALVPSWSHRSKGSACSSASLQVPGFRDSLCWALPLGDHLHLSRPEALWASKCPSA